MIDMAALHLLFIKHAIDSNIIQISGIDSLLLLYIYIYRERERERERLLGKIKIIKR